MATTRLAVLALESVSKSFGDLRAAQAISFEVRAGEVFGFLGPNGAGKTTTLRMIMGITRPDSGAVRFEGRPKLDRRRVGYLPEERGLYEDVAILQTLVYLGSLRGMPRPAARAAALAWLERLGLADRATHKLQTLSKGNQQKVQFVAAVLHTPALAVLDEPFSGLDPLNQELFVSLIGELRDQGMAVLVSAHHLDLVQRLCDRFFLIARGRHVLSGTLAEMRARVTGGASELLTLLARPRDGGGADALRAALDRIAPDVRVHPLADGSLEAQIPLAANADLGPLIAAVAPRFSIQRTDMRPVPLHEIYLRAVGGDRDQAERELEGASRD